MRREGQRSGLVEEIKWKAKRPIKPKFWGGFISRLLKRLVDRVKPQVLKEYAQKVKVIREKQKNFTPEEAGQWVKILDKLEKEVGLKDDELAFLESIGGVVGEDFEQFLKTHSVTIAPTQEPTGPVTPTTPTTPTSPTSPTGEQTIASHRRLSFRVAENSVKHLSHRD